MFAAQGPGENDLGISSTWTWLWTKVITKFSQDIQRWTQVASNSSQYSPKMTPGCLKMAPERTQVALKSSQDSFKVKASRPKVQGPGSRRGSAGPRRVCNYHCLLCVTYLTCLQLHTLFTVRLQNAYNDDGFPRYDSKLHKISMLVPWYDCENLQILTFFLRYDIKML